MNIVLSTRGILSSCDHTSRTVSKEEYFISKATLAEAYFYQRWLLSCFAKPSDLYKAFGQASSVNDGATTSTIVVASINLIVRPICPFSLTVALPALVGVEELPAITGCNPSLSALLISRRAFLLPSTLSLRPFGYISPPTVPIWKAVAKDICSRSTSSHSPALLCNHRPHHQTTGILLFCIMHRVSPLETITTISWTGHAIQCNCLSVIRQAGVLCRTKPSICHTLLLA